MRQRSSCRGSYELSELAIFFITPEFNLARSFVSGRSKPGDEKSFSRKVDRGSGGILILIQTVFRCIASVILLIPPELLYGYGPQRLDLFLQAGYLSSLVRKGVGKII